MLSWLILWFELTSFVYTTLSLDMRDFCLGPMTSPSLFVIKKRCLLSSSFFWAARRCFFWPLVSFLGGSRVIGLCSTVCVPFCAFLQHTELIPQSFLQLFWNWEDIHFKRMECAILSCETNSEFCNVQLRERRQEGKTVTTRMWPWIFPFVLGQSCCCMHRWGNLSPRGCDKIKRRIFKKNSAHICLCNLITKFCARIRGKGGHLSDKSSSMMNFFNFKFCKLLHASRRLCCEGPWAKLCFLVAWRSRTARQKRSLLIDATNGLDIGQ